MTDRGHRLLPHTADVGLEAFGPDLPATFEEAALALARLTADVAPPSPTAPLEDVSLDGRDLPALAFCWLNELVARIDLGGALAEVRVQAVEPEPAGDWALRARVATAPFDGVQVRRRADVKSATYHGLLVEREPGGGWRLVAYLDV